VKLWDIILGPRFEFKEAAFASLVEFFCRVTGHLPTGHEYSDSEMIGVITRFTNIGLAHADNVSFEVTRTLVHSFECVVVGVEQDTHYSSRILNTPEAYVNRIAAKSHSLHYKLLKLLVRTFQSCPAAQQHERAKEIVSILWLGPAFLDGRSWKEMCIADGMPVSQQQPLAIAEDPDSSPDPAEVSQVIFILQVIVEELEKLVQPNEENGTPATLDPSKVQTVQTCIDAIRSKLPESTRDLRVITCIPFIELVCDVVNLVVNAEGGD
jgi:hypothetical protein